MEVAILPYLRMGVHRYAIRVAEIQPSIDIITSPQFKTVFCLHMFTKRYKQPPPAKKKQVTKGMVFRHNAHFYFPTTRVPKIVLSEFFKHGGHLS